MLYQNDTKIFIFDGWNVTNIYRRGPTTTTEQQKMSRNKFWDDDDKCTSYKIQTFFPFIIYIFILYFFCTHLWSDIARRCGIFMHDKLINFVDQRKMTVWQQKRRKRDMKQLFICIIFSLSSSYPSKEQNQFLSWNSFFFYEHLMNFISL